MIPAKKKESNKADFAFDPEGGRQEDVGEVQAFHLLLMLLRYMQIRSIGYHQRYTEVIHDPLLFSVAQGLFGLFTERLSRSTLHLKEGESPPGLPLAPHAAQVHANP
jgi:hypothetical protein